MTWIREANWRTNILWLALWAVAITGVLAFRAEPRRTPLFEDEVYWIGSAYYYELARRGDWQNADWKVLPARENPPLAKFVIGLTLAATGQHVESPDLLGCFYLMFANVPGAWGQGEDRAKRSAVVERMNPGFRQQVPPGTRINLAPTVLVSPRLVMVLCLALTSLLSFLFARSCGDSVTALVGGAALLLHPIAVDAFNHVTADAVALLFSTAAAAATLALFRALRQPAPDKATVAGRILGAGALSGLACAAKMNSLVIVALAAAVLGWTVIDALGKRDQQRARLAALSAIAAAAVAVVTFIAINPALYHDMAGGLAATVTEHRRTEVIQRAFLAGRLDSLPARFVAVGGVLVLVPSLLFVGITIAVAMLRSASIARQFVAVWWLVALVCVTLWIPFQRLRYVAPLLVPTFLLGVCAIASLIDWLKSRARTRAASN